MYFDGKMFNIQKYPIHYAHRGYLQINRYVMFEF